MLLIASAAEQEQSAIAGLVTDAATGKPLSQVDVRLIQRETDGTRTVVYGALSDSDGKFSVAPIPAGTYELEPRRRGYFFVPSARNGPPSFTVTIKTNEPLRAFRIEMTPAAILAGHVLDENGQPAGMNQAGVMLEVTSPKDSVLLFALDGAGLRRQTVVNGKGEYRISVPAGKYFLSANASPGEEIRSDGTVDAVPLVPEAVMSGRVLDSHDEPVQAALVRADSANWRGAVETDDRGEFLFTELPAGRYFLRVQPPRNDDPAEIRTDGSKEEWYGPTWYPSARSKSESAAVEIAGGVQTDGIEIRLVRIPIVRVAGSVTGAPSGMQFGVTAAEQPENNTAYAAVRDGRFEFWRLPPGHYAISALTVSPDGRRLAAVPVPVDVANSNVDNLTLALIPEFEIAGRIEWDGTPPPAEGLREAAIRMGPPSLVEGDESAANGRIGSDGGFRVQHVTVGRKRIVLTGMPETVYVKSLRLGSVEVSEAELDLGADPKDARLLLVLSTSGAEVSGVVMNDAESPVSAEVCLSPDRSEAGCGRQMSSGEDGKFLFRGLAPGKYRLSVTGLDDSMQILELHEGEKARQDLKTGK